MKILTLVAYPFMLIALSGKAQDRQHSIEEFAWLAGCWGRSGENWFSVEQWMKPAGGIMLGMSRTVRGNEMKEFEFLQLREDPDGGISYVAIPSGQTEASFKLVCCGDRGAVFENLQHDFPRRIVYRLQSDGTLHARIEGTMNGTERGVDFFMKRESCE